MSRLRLTAGSFCTALAASALVCGVVVEWIVPARIELWRNIVLLFSFGVCGLHAWMRRRPGAPLPVPKSNALIYLCIAIAGLIATARNINYPYLADDWQLLATRGALPFPECSFTILPGEIWYRPVGWGMFRLFYLLSPDSAFIPHLICNVLFSAVAAISFAALRRCGLPRGVAAAAALLYALSPAAFETVSWVTNIYSILGTGFSLAAIAFLPMRRPGFSNMLPVCLFATCAFLSKEDSYLLPLWIAAAGARFHWRWWRAGLWRALPVIVILITIVGVRQVQLGNSGAYRDASGNSVLLQRAFRGPQLALLNELPAGYILPARETPRKTLPRAVWWGVPLLILAWGGAGVAMRRAMPAGLFIFIIGLAPVAALLPIGFELECARWLMLPTVGIVAMVAAALSGGMLRGRAAWIPIALFAGASVLVTGQNARAWSQSSDAVRKASELLKPALAKEPPRSRVIIAGLPWVVKGVVCFNCGVPWYYELLSGRRDLFISEPTTFSGVYESIYELNIADNSIQPWMDGTVVDLSGGASWKYQFGKEPGRDREVRMLNVYVIESGDGIVLRPGISGNILLPVFQRDPDAELVVRLDAEWVDDDKIPPPAVNATASAINAAGARVNLRRHIPKGENVVFEGTSPRVRLDITIPHGAPLRIRSIEVSQKAVR